MLLRATYNRNPETLGDVPKEAFAETMLEMVKHRHPECILRITFDNKDSGVKNVTHSDDTPYNEEFSNLAEEAYQECICTLNLPTPYSKAMDTIVGALEEFAKCGPMRNDYEAILCDVIDEIEARGGKGMAKTIADWNDRQEAARIAQQLDDEEG
jgi:hypothetical protein